MKLYQYWKALSLLKAEKDLDTIQQVTGLPVSDIIKMENGARIAPHILLQMSGVFEKCPKCGHKVLLPCYICYCREHPELTCIEPIPRPIRNQEMPLSVTLDVDLLSDED